MCIDGKEKQIKFEPKKKKERCRDPTKVNIIDERTGRAEHQWTRRLNAYYLAGAPLYL